MTRYNLNEKSNNALLDELGLPGGDLALHAVITSGISYAAFIRLAKLLCIDVTKLATCLSITPVVFENRKEVGRFTAEESDNIYRVVCVFSAAIVFFEGDHKKAAIWFQSKVKGLGGNKPIDLLSTSAGGNAVIEIIQRLEHGVFV